MNSKHTLLALDVGERRVGVALASSAARLAAPLTTIEMQDTDDVYATVKDLVAKHEAKVIVVGLPRGLNGQETQQTLFARDFAAKLQTALPDKVIVMQDEAGTSVEAKELLKQRRKPYSKADIDAEAAALILRDYLQHSAGATA